MRMGPGQRLRGRPVHHPARPREMRAGAGEERVVVGPQDACPSTCPHRDWDSHCGGPAERACGSRASRGRSMLSLPAGTRGEGPSRRESGGPWECSGGSAFAGGHLPRGFMKAARPERPPASPPPPAPPPARAPSPRPVPPRCQGAPYRERCARPGPRATAGKETSLASLSACS